MRPGKQPGICGACRNGLVKEDDRGDRQTFCNTLMQPLRITRPVVRCTDYEERVRESEHDMRQVAWVLRTDKRGHVGFAPPNKDKDIV